MKYKVGDKIRLKGTDSDGTVIDIIVRGQLLINLSDGSKIVEWPENVVLIEGLVEEEEIGFTEEDKYWCDIMSESAPNTYVLPEGYQFVDENGNVINATKIVLEKKKSKWPKAIWECHNILSSQERLEIEDSLAALEKLLICRDAYLKIAGEEMGLDGPWEPDWLDDTAHKFIIHTIKDKIHCGGSLVKNHLLAFPTEEMRDAFYENFKELIESCKELL